MNAFLAALHRVFAQRYGNNPNSVLGSRYLQHMGTLPEAQNPLVQRALGGMMYGSGYNPAEPAQAKYAPTP